MKISKILKSWFVSCMILAGVSVEAENNVQDLKLMSDASFNSIFFYTTLVEDKTQIQQSIKLYESPTWGTAFVVSDPDVSVTAFNVRKDHNDNLVVGWIGENTLLGVYSLYIRYYVASTTTWSPITIVSTPLQNLVGNFSVSINTVEAEIIYTIYDENYATVNQSATYTL